jgi:hypothetical protein
MPPAQLLNDYIPIKESLAHMDWMIATDFVIFYSFILRVVVLVELKKKLM